MSESKFIPQFEPGTLLGIVLCLITTLGYMLSFSFYLVLKTVRVQSW